MITINDVNRVPCLYGKGECENEGQMFTVIHEELTMYCLLGSKNFNVTSSDLTGDPVNMDGVIDLDTMNMDEPMFVRQQMADEANDYLALQKEYES